jgi:hypothetical protein
MTKMTKAQLVDENIRLRAECDRLERLSDGISAAHIAATLERDEALDALHRLKDELLASKLPQPVEPSPFRIVTIRGERFAKVPSVVQGRTIYTYKPLSAH